MDYHLGPDHMHLHFQYKNLIPNSINDYFVYLSSIPSTLPFKTLGRFSEAKARQNHRRHLQLTLKQQQYVLKRSVSSSWCLPSIKTYLHEHHIKFAKLPPIHRNILRIQFNNEHDLQAAESVLTQATFL